MGRRGPAPTPSDILKARGSWRGDANPNEPQPDSGAPPKPARLRGDASLVWDAVVGLIAPGVLTRDAGETLARYCHGVVRWWKLADWLDENDEVYEVTDQMGNVRHVRHPNVITYEKLGPALLRMEQEFGLTAASRTRVYANVKGDKPAAARRGGEGDAPPPMRLAK